MKTVGAVLLLAGVAEAHDPFSVDGYLYPTFGVLLGVMILLICLLRKAHREIASVNQKYLSLLRSAPLEHGRMELAGKHPAPIHHNEQNELNVHCVSDLNSPFPSVFDPHARSSEYGSFRGSMPLGNPRDALFVYPNPFQCQLGGSSCYGLPGQPAYDGWTSSLGNPKRGSDATSRAGDEG